MTDARKLMMDLMGFSHENAHSANPAPAEGGEDTADLDLGMLIEELELTEEEVEQLQLPVPEGGPSLAQRLEALRPGLDFGGMRINLTGSGIEGRRRF